MISASCLRATSVQRLHPHDLSPQDIPSSLSPSFTTACFRPTTTDFTMAQVTVITADSLKYAGADVVVSSPRPDSEFLMLLHSKDLPADSAFFSGSFSGKFNTKSSVRGRDGDVMKFWHLELDYDAQQKMVTLKNKVGSLSPSSSSLVLTHTRLSASMIVRQLRVDGSPCASRSRLCHFCTKITYQGVAQLSKVCGCTTPTRSFNTQRLFTTHGSMQSL